jgi:hypothetical protein
MAVRLLSYDVGIKNLAYCIVDISPDHTLSMVEWNVLDLCSSDGPVCRICTEKLKNGRTCGKKAKYCKGDEANCEKHAAISKKYRLPTKDHTAASLKKLKIGELREIWTKENIVKPNDNHDDNNNKKKEDVLNDLLEYYRGKEWEIIAVPKKQNASKTDLITLGRSLHAQLSVNPIMSTVTHVIIENQISPIANRMKTIQGMIAQHYISLGISSIEFVSSGNKLKNLAKQSNATTGYKQNKKDGIFYCEKYLRDNRLDTKWVDIFTKSPKKDDLSDCFLQALWWKGNQKQAKGD